MELSKRLPRFEGKIDALHELLSKYDAVSPEVLHNAFAVERAVMQMQVEWELFVRGLILDCATGNFADGHGQVVSSHPTTLPTRERAGHYLVAQYPRSDKEPNWYVPAEAVRAASLLGVSNLANISAQLGVSPWPLDDLRHLRNFIGHRSKSSALKVRQVGLVSPSNRIDTIDVTFAFNNTGTRNYVGWGQFMKYIARQLVR